MSDALTDPNTFRLAMQQLAATVTVITADVARPAGITATAVMSLSASPASLVIAINQSASFHGQLRTGANLCVNALSRQQTNVCKAFGGGVAAAQRFATGSWKFDDPRGPYFADAVANIFCRVDMFLDHATHTLAMVHMTGLRCDLEREPLIYLRGGFQALQSGPEVWGMPF